MAPPEDDLSLACLPAQADRNHVLLPCSSARGGGGALRIAASREDRPGPSPAPGRGGAPAPLPGWAWALCWAALAVAVGLLVRLPGPATLDPDEHAAVLYFDRLVAGDRLEGPLPAPPPPLPPAAPAAVLSSARRAAGHRLGEPLRSSPEHLLTVAHGLAWRAAHDWRPLEAV